MDKDELILGQVPTFYVPRSEDPVTQLNACLCNKLVTPAPEAILGSCEFYYRPLQEEYVNKSGVAGWQVLKFWASNWNPWNDESVASKLIAMRDQLIVANSSDGNWSRHTNFMVRHIGCGHQPPDYYVSYGYYYCSTYGAKLNPHLSEVGQKWLRDARKNLQKNMEKGLEQNMKGTNITIVCRRYPNRTVNMTVPQYELEVTPDTFKTFAFQTHVPAYLDAGLADLPIADLRQIGGQPNIEEWGDRETWEQVIDSSLQVATDWANDGIRFIDDTYEATKDKVDNLIDSTLESLTRHLRF